MSKNPLVLPFFEGNLHASMDMRPSPPTAGFLDPRTPEEVTADVAAYGAAYTGEMLRQIAQQTRK